MQDTNQNPKSARAQKEEQVLSFWQDNAIFEKTLDKEKTQGEFVFYEGPPTANGTPGIHHLEARAFKDIIPRYKTMKGYHVPRKGGWDTHGLPVELQVEKELGLKSKKEVEQYGVAAFNKKCKESVWRYLDLWNEFTYRIGYWVDQKNPYVTYHNSYIESLWNIVGEINKKNLLYKDYKVVPWCARCGTGLSSHELAQGYQDVKDLSVYAKFKVTPGQKIGDTEVDDNTYILAWTTTPWTLPGNVALAVGEDIEYVKVKIDNKNVLSTVVSVENGVNKNETLISDGIYILAKEKIGLILGKHEVLETIKGSDLVGLSYVPLYPYLKDAIAQDESYTDSRDKAFKVYGADFVTTTDGTGVVHTAVMYGQDDFELGTKIGLPKFHTVNEDGTFKENMDFLTGRFVKDEDVAIDVIKDLAHRGLLFKKEKYEHSYPHCWRCKTPLIYYARDSWYIQMSKLRDEMVAENKEINWEPAYTRDGRFGEWLKDIKDWAISRERYWGTPLPIWEKENGQRVVIDSIDTLKKHTKKSGNTYFAMRHGKTFSNEKGVWDFEGDPKNHLTDEGKEQIKNSVKLFNEKIDIIICSPMLRTKETAELFKELSQFSGDLIFDERLREYNPGSKYQGTPVIDFLTFFKTYPERYTKINPDGENYQNLKDRVMATLMECESKYQNKKILFVSHGGPILNMILGAQGAVHSTIVENIEELAYPKNAEIRKIDFVPLPHNEHYELDLHKPYIDEVKLFDEDGQKMTRVKEVMDVWFDSGCMPFAQDHYPFSGKEVAYPADFISEAIDQTRGWFYTLHAVGTLLGRGKAYKNVICLGHILDAEGKKMSKSLGNIVDPWMMMEKYGVDPLRFFMYTVNQPGESKNFDEKTVQDIERKVFNLLENVYTFYDLYRDKNLETNDYPTSTHVLDQWILAELSKTVTIIEDTLDNYKVLEGGRQIREFIDGLSTWYLRRSRERLKDGDADAKRTLYFVLKTLSKVIAPFIPFTGEELYQKIRLENDVESVHLENWPTLRAYDTHALDTMKIVRELVTLGLQARQKEGIAVRQPLSKITFKNNAFEKVYTDILEDELNIKEIVFNEAQDQDVVLDTEITEALKQEGTARELMRIVQDMRKKKGLQPSDTIVLIIDTNEAGQAIVTIFKDEIQKVVGATDIVFQGTQGEVFSVADLEYIISLS